MLATEAVAAGTGFSELIPGNVDSTFNDLCADLSNKFEKGFNEAMAPARDCGTIAQKVKGSPKSKKK